MTTAPLPTRKPTPPAITDAVAATGGGAFNPLTAATMFAGGSPIPGGLSLGMTTSSEAKGETGQVTPTGWGALNNPLIIATNGAQVRDVRTDQTAPTSIDQSIPLERSANAANRGGMVGGMASSNGLMFLAIGALVAVAAVRLAR